LWGKELPPTEPDITINAKALKSISFSLNNEFPQHQQLSHPPSTNIFSELPGGPNGIIPGQDVPRGLIAIFSGAARAFLTPARTMPARSPRKRLFWTS
jgi:hypothetical protein